MIDQFQLIGCLAVLNIDAARQALHLYQIHLKMLPRVTLLRFTLHPWITSGSHRPSAPDGLIHRDVCTGASHSDMPAPVRQPRLARIGLSFRSDAVFFRAAPLAAPPIVRSTVADRQ